MSIRSFALATTVAALLAPAAASAAPTTVQLRVEGATQTLFEGPVTTDGHAIDKGGGPHPCDGTNGGANPVAGPTMTSALDDWSRSGGLPWTGTWFDFGDFGIDSIGPDAARLPNGPFWGYALNFVPSQVGGCQQQVQEGDEVLYGYDFFSKAHLLRLDGPPRAVTGQPFQVTVTDGQTGAPLDGAAVPGGSGLTDAAGHTTVTVGTSGLAVAEGGESRLASLEQRSTCACRPPAPTTAASHPGSSVAPRPASRSRTASPRAR